MWPGTVPVALFLVSGWEVSVSKTPISRMKAWKAVRNGTVGKRQRGGVNHPENSVWTPAIQLDLISVNDRAEGNVMGLSPGAVLKAGRPFWKSNSHIDSNLPALVFFPSDALNSDFIQDASPAHYHNDRNSHLCHVRFYLAEKSLGLPAPLG